MPCYDVDDWGAKGIALAEGYQERDGKMSPELMLENKKALKKERKKWADGVKRNWGSVLPVAFGLNADRWAHVMLGRGRIDCGRVAFVASRTKMPNGSGLASGRRESRAASLLAVVGDWTFKDRSRRDDEVNQLGRPKRSSGSRHPMSQPGCRGCTRGKRYEGDGTARNRRC